MSLIAAMKSILLKQRRAQVFVRRLVYASGVPVAEPSESCKKSDPDGKIFLGGGKIFVGFRLTRKRRFVLLRYTIVPGVYIFENSDKTIDFIG